MTREELNQAKAAISALKVTKRGAAQIAAQILEKYDGLSSIVKTGLKAVGLDKLFENLRDLTQ